MIYPVSRALRALASACIFLARMDAARAHGESYATHHGRAGYRPSHFPLPMFCDWFSYSHAFLWRGWLLHVPIARVLGRAGDGG